MNLDETRRLVELARRIGCTPRRVLVTAACMVEGIGVTKAVNDLRHCGDHSFTVSDECANLLLTPVGSFARVELDSALAMLWRDHGPHG